ncbi:tRNA-dihydrouridine synthase [Natrarchaeobaculum sulfurireducens]|uniref:tRNA dihydrouridine synthase B like n=1 Tax=Natrarchaeobaculum sulfurireducens TaxID=2044521 RepID=A0A346PRU3_9EURY|nr:tRNA-dihydrouridine synthase [Natrarchaeobaculum sulfurireducens]AXR82238.1 tRNA dihydrouridine synthase B like [Natrarchaeobaculum sulfurireducens]
MVSFTPRLALASLSGEADADWARAGATYAGAAFLGGIALDDASRAAARDLVERDRTEFLPPEPLAFVDDQLAALTDVPIQPAFNVRSATPGPVVEAARICRDRDALLEINAHCRQNELCAVGCGETLLADADRLQRYVEQASATGATVGVKVRTEVPGVDLAALACDLEDAGATFVHVDAMDSESVIADVVSTTDLFVIANNGVRDEPTVREYVEYGADAVSVGRPSDNPVVLERVRDAVDRHLGVEATR